MPQVIQLRSPKHPDHASLNAYIMATSDLLTRMEKEKQRGSASQINSRELSLAYTAIEEARHWLRDLNDRKIEEGYQ